MELTLREYVFMLGAALFVGGVLALLMPVGARDELSPGKIDCGYGFGAEHTDYLTPRSKAACEDAVSDRQAWAIPLAIGGLLVAMGGFAVPKRKEHEPAKDSAD